MSFPIPLGLLPFPSLLSFSPPITSLNASGRSGCFIIEKGKNKFDNPGRNAKDLKATANSSYLLSKTRNASVNQLLAAQLVGLWSLQLQIKDLDQVIMSYILCFLLF